MKKTALILIMLIAAAAGAAAQKFAMVDMEYIMRNVPAYEMAGEQLNQLSLRWQREVEAVGKEAETMYQNFLADKVFLTDDQPGPVIRKQTASPRKRKRGHRPAIQILRPRGRALQKAHHPAQAHTGRGLQRHQESGVAARLPGRV